MVFVLAVVNWNVSAFELIRALATIDLQGEILPTIESMIHRSVNIALYFVLLEISCGPDAWYPQDPPPEPSPPRHYVGYLYKYTGMDL